MSSSLPSEGVCLILNEDKTLVRCGEWADFGLGVTKSRSMLQNELEGAISIHQVITLIAPRIDCRKATAGPGATQRAKAGPGVK